MTSIFDQPEFSPQRCGISLHRGNPGEDVFRAAHDDCARSRCGKDALGNVFRDIVKPRERGSKRHTALTRVRLFARRPPRVSRRSFTGPGALKLGFIRRRCVIHGRDCRINDGRLATQRDRVTIVRGTCEPGRRRSQQSKRSHSVGDLGRDSQREARSC